MPGADVIYNLSSSETTLFCLIRTRRGLCRINLDRVPEFIFLFTILVDLYSCLPFRRSTVESQDRNYSIQYFITFELGFKVIRHKQIWNTGLVNKLCRIIFGPSLCVHFHVYYEPLSQLLTAFFGVLSVESQDFNKIAYSTLNFEARL